MRGEECVIVRFRVGDLLLKVAPTIEEAIEEISPLVKAMRRKYYQRPEVKAMLRKYYQRPEVKAKKHEYYLRHRRLLRVERKND